jgi:hypothetical protein
MVKVSTVDEYVSLHEPWKQDILTKLREIVKKNAPNTKESIKWAQPVYENDDGPFCFIRAHKNHVNIGFWRGAIIDDPHHLLEGDGVKMRHIKITQETDIEDKKIGDFVQQAIKLNQELGNPTR